MIFGLHTIGVATVMNVLMILVRAIGYGAMIMATGSAISLGLLELEALDGDPVDLWALGLFGPYLQGIIVASALVMIPCGMLLLLHNPREAADE